MKLVDCEVFVVGNPPPRKGGRYFIFVKLTTACGVTGIGEAPSHATAPLIFCMSSMLLWMKVTDSRTK